MSKLNGKITTSPTVAFDATIRNGFYWTANHSPVSLSDGRRPLRGTRKRGGEELGDPCWEKRRGWAREGSLTTKSRRSNGIPPPSPALRPTVRTILCLFA